MSSFAEYDIISTGYDEGRNPNGAELYLGLVYSLTKKTADQLNLLDLGCGTGNHVTYLFEQGLGKATIFDANNTMLEQTRAKLKNFQDRVTIEQHVLPTVPYQDNTFDVVMSNQVFHHLTTPGDTKHEIVQKTIEEAYRVLKPNGVLIINLCTPYQALHSVWYGKVYPKSNAIYAQRMVEPNQLLSMMRCAGFKKEGMVVEPLDVMYSKERYFKEDGPLFEDWRRVDSMSAYAMPEEIEEATEKVQKMKKEGTLKDFMKDADSMREHIGQYAVYYAKKV